MTPHIDTDRLSLVPLRPDDAPEMVGVLADPGLYAFTGGEPPALAALEARYRGWTAGSATPGEAWHNWIVRLAQAGLAIGHVQATVLVDGRSALIAWLIGAPWQGRGYATEAARALVGWLEAAGVNTITAYIHPGNAASGRVAAHVGLAPTDEVVDGEFAWRRVHGLRHT